MSTPFIPVNTPLLDGNEADYLAECIRTGWISSEGPFIKRFEQAMAKAAGRDPAALQLIVRGNVLLSKKPLGQDRALFSGTLDQLQEDVAACREIGAHEVFFDPSFTEGAQDLHYWLELMANLRKISS